MLLWNRTLVIHIISEVYLYLFLVNPLRWGQDFERFLCLILAYVKLKSHLCKKIWLLWYLITSFWSDIGLLSIWSLSFNDIWIEFKQMIYFKQNNHHAWSRHMCFSRRTVPHVAYMTAVSYPNCVHGCYSQYLEISFPRFFACLSVSLPHPLSASLSAPYPCPYNFVSVCLFLCIHLSSSPAMSCFLLSLLYLPFRDIVG